MEAWTVIPTISSTQAVNMKNSLLEDEEFVLFTQPEVGLYDGEQQSKWQQGTALVTPLRILYFTDTNVREGPFGVLYLPLSLVGSLSKWRGLGSWSHPKVVIQLNRPALSHISSCDNYPTTGVSEAAHQGKVGAPLYKLSFRGGGMEGYHNALSNAVDKQMWTLQSSVKQRATAPALTSIAGSKANRSVAPAGSTSTGPSPPTATAPTPSSGEATTSPTGNAGRTFDASTAGITGLLRKNQGQAQERDSTLGEAMKDIDGVMQNASTVVEEINQINKALLLSQQKSTSGGTSGGLVKIEAEAAVQLEAMRRTLGLPCPVSLKTVGSREKFYVEVAKELRAWMNKPGNPLRTAIVVSVIELFALYNRARGGLDLLSPQDMRKACDALQESYPSEFKLVKYSSGLVVLQRIQSDEEVLSTLEAILGPRPKSFAVLLDRESHALRLSSASESQLCSHLKVSLTIGKVILEDLEMDEVLCRSETDFGQVLFHWNVFALR